MAAYTEYLKMLHSDPSNAWALSELQKLGPSILSTSEVADALDKARTQLLGRGASETAVELFDVELEHAEGERQANLLFAKGVVVFDDLLKVESGLECMGEALRLQPENQATQDKITHLEEVKANWQAIVEKFVEEAEATTESSLATSLYRAAAETYGRYQPDAVEIEEYLRKALEIEPGNVRAQAQLARLLSRGERWQELLEQLKSNIAESATVEERNASWLRIAELGEGSLADPSLAVHAMQNVIAAEPGNTRALAYLASQLEKEEDWTGAVTLYTNALKARRRSGSPETEIDLLIQVGMLHWKKLEDPEAADEYFTRLRKLSPAHQVHLDFYREYYVATEQSGKLMQVYRQALKAAGKDGPERKKALMVELAQLSEGSMDNPEKAIDSWKSILRSEPENTEAIESLRRLYERTGKWNALLDLIKDEVEKIPSEDVEARVHGLLEVAEIYRDQLKLDVMVINTYNSILVLDPSNLEVLQALSEKYRSLGRWNDLITVLGRKAKLESVTLEKRIEILEQISSLWIDRFGNYAQAIKPLEELLSIDPSNQEALTRLKEIYTRRRQWRALIALLGREAETMPVAQRRAHFGDMARLAGEKLGDTRLSIDIWNRVLELPGSTSDPDECAADYPLVLDSLSALYEREKRYPALAEILRRKHKLAVTPDAAIPVLEKLGTLYSDRIKSAELAAEVYSQILELRPDHAKAARVLRELYASAHNYDALEALYGRMDHWEELVESYFAISDRLDTKEETLALLERAARVANARISNPDKVARVYERLQSVEPTHLGAAQSLAILYRDAGKWPRLLSTQEILLGHADEADRLPLIDDIRELCENQLASKSLAFQWTTRAYEIRPEDSELLAGLLRLAMEADAWPEVSVILDARVQQDSIGEQEKIRLLRELGRISENYLDDKAAAQRYHEEILTLRNDDNDALEALESLATKGSQWGQLLVILRKRVELGSSSERQIELLSRIALLEEDQQGNIEGALAAHENVLELDADNHSTLQALDRIYQASSDWSNLVRILNSKLRLATDPSNESELHFRLGGLYQDALEKPEEARESYKRCLQIDPNSDVYGALEQYLSDRYSEEVRLEIANLLMPIFAEQKEYAKLANSIEILKGAADEYALLSFEEELATLYEAQLNDPAMAYEASGRLLLLDPGNELNRNRLDMLGKQLGRIPELRTTLEAGLLASVEQNCDESVGLAIALEIAVLSDEILDEPEAAEKAWLHVASIDEANTNAYEALSRLYRRSDKWQELKSHIEAHITRTLDTNERVRGYWQLAELCEGVLEEQAGAIGAFEGIIEVDPSQSRAFDALANIRQQNGDWSELESLLTLRSDVLQDEDLEANDNRRARLRADKLGDARGAIDLAEELLVRRPSDELARQLLEEFLSDNEVRQRVAKILEPNYEERGDWAEYCRVLHVQAETADMPSSAFDLYVRIAEVQESERNDLEAANSAWFEALKAQPSDSQSMDALQRLALTIGGWDTLASALESAAIAVDETDVASRSRLLRNAGDIARDQLGDSDRALASYETLLDLEGSDPETILYTANALDSLYGQKSDFARQAAVLRKASEWSDSSPDRISLLSRIAEIEEIALEDKAAALSTWTQVLGEDPENRVGLSASDRLLEEAGNYRDLVEIVRRQIGLCEDDAGERAKGLVRLSTIYVDKCDEAQEGILCLLEVLDLDVDHEGVLVTLSGLYQKEERFDDLLDTLERRVSAAEGASRTSLVFEKAVLLTEKLDRPSEALDCFAEVLNSEATHQESRDHLLQMVSNRDLRGRAAEVLDPLLEQSGDFPALISLLESLIVDNDDQRDVMLSLQRIATLQELPLSDSKAAFESLCRALRVGLSEPELPGILTELQRLASDNDALGELATVYREVAGDIYDGDLQRRLYLDIADLSRAVLNDNDTARKYYRLVLEAQPDDQRAITALDLLYRENGDYFDLYNIIVQKAELAGDDLSVRAQCLSEAGSLCAEKLDRIDDAAMHWEQVLELTPDAREVATSLQRLYKKQERWHDLAESLESRLGFALTVDEAVDLRFRLGQLYELHLTDPDAAVENYGAALGGDSTHKGATAALERLLDDPGTRNSVGDILEPIYVAQQNWPQLVRIYEIKLEAADSSEERLPITKYIASLYEDQLGDLDGAFHWLGRVFRECPSDQNVRMQLERLASNLENFGRLAAVYQSYIDEENSESDEAMEIAETLADTYNTELGQVDKALSAYKRVLQMDSTRLAVFVRTEEMLSRASRWRDLVDLYEDAIQVSLDEERRQNLYSSLAAVQEVQLESPDKAIEALRAILDINPNRNSAVATLDRILVSQENWYDLADLLTSRIDIGCSESEERDIRLRLAVLREEKVEDVDGAIDEYEKTLAMPDSHAALAALERLVVEERHQERIAGILESVYRTNDSWQKLVVILDTQLKHVDDPIRRGEMLREIAGIHETRGGDLSLALIALGKAWLEDTSDNDLYTHFVNLGTSLGNSEYLIETLEAGIVDQYDYDLVGVVLVQLASIKESFHDDTAAAIGYLIRLLELCDDHPVALSDLDRLLTQTEDWNGLVRTLERRAEVDEDQAKRLEFLKRIAHVHEVLREDVEAAIVAHRNVLSFDERDSLSLQALERLYASTENWTELASVLLRKVELSESVSDKRQIHFELASLYEDKLSDAYEAIAQTRAILELDASDRPAMDALCALYEKESMWQDMLETVDQQISVAAGDDLVDRNFAAAELLQQQLVDIDGAQSRYATVLDLQATHPGARKALEEQTHNPDTITRACEILEPIYSAEGNHDALAAIYETRISASEGEELGLFVTLAELHEVSRGDLPMAFSTWSRAVQVDPLDQATQAQVERVVSSIGNWQELVELYENVLASTSDPQVEARYASRIGALYEDNIGDLGKAAGAFERALEVGEDEQAALAALARIYERDGKFNELADTYGRQAEVTMDDSVQANLLFMLGDVRENRLASIPDAIESYRKVLERDSSHAGGRAALERLLSNEDERTTIIAILEPLYEDDGDSARLASLLRVKVSTVSDSYERAQIYARVTELCELELGDLTSALDAVGSWLAEDAMSDDALGKLLSLGASLSREGEVAARLDGIASASDDNSVQVRLGHESARLKIEKLGDLDGALVSLDVVLSIEPDDSVALELLQRVCRDKGDVARLAEVTWHRAEITYDHDNKRTLMVESARLRGELQQADKAEEAWKAVLELEEGDREAQEALAAHYRVQGKHQELVDILGIAARYAADGEVERLIKVEIAQVTSDSIGDFDLGAQAWQSVLDLDSNNLEALNALESLHRRREDFVAVQDVLLRRIDIVEADEERIAVYLRIAQVARLDREAPEEAADFLRNVLDIDPSNDEANEQLELILRSLERWHDLVDLLVRRADTCGIQDNRMGELHWLAQTADIWEDKLENSEEAAEILEKILARDPNSVAALTRLAKIYEGNDDWERCETILQKALALGPQGKEAADLYVRLGEVARNKDEDEEKAQEYFVGALGFDGYHSVAVAHVEASAREREEWPMVADMVRRRYETTQDPSAKIDLCVELADLYGARIGQPEQVIPLLESALQSAPDDPRILAPLADLYYYAGRHAEAAPMFETLAEEAKKKRRMKDVAGYKERLAGIFHASGDMDAALSAYEEAFRVDPTNVKTMAGLGSLYYGKQDWDKARRIYRSMVLQNIDPSVGITKADVYFYLGEIHKALGEVPKAKDMYKRALSQDAAHAHAKAALEAMG